MKRAVVFGASLSGLLAARALADFYSEVVVVERDKLPTSPSPRRGVPQTEHNHVLLAQGAREYESLLPGLTEELLGAGAPHVDMMRQTRMVFSGYELARGDCDTKLIHASRGLLEHAVRSRVKGLSNVEFREGCEATGIVHEDGRVTAARVTRLADGNRVETLASDLVVDALGRGGRAATWLTELGYEAPAEDRVKCDVRYVSRFVSMPADALNGDHFLLVGAAPGLPHLLAACYLEGDRWMLTLAGMAGVRPPSTDEGIQEFAETMPIPDFCETLREAKPLSDPVALHYPYSVRRRFERLRRFPDGLLVVGDALCSFNPVYGQGMTVAGMQARILRECLAEGSDNLAQRFFPAASKAIDVPWSLGAGGDLAMPEVEGYRSPRIRLLNRYVARVHRAASRDPRVAAVFFRVAGLLEPPSALLRPGFMARVFTSRAPRRRDPRGA